MQLWVIIQAHAWGELQERIWLLFKESHSEEHPQLDSLINSAFRLEKVRSQKGSGYQKLSRKTGEELGFSICGSRCFV